MTDEHRNWVRFGSTSIDIDRIAAELIEQYRWPGGEVEHKARELARLLRERADSEEAMLNARCGGKS